MKKHRIIWLKILLCLGLLISCQSNPETLSVPVSPFQVDFQDCGAEYRGEIHGTIENRSSDAIEIGGWCAFSFYIWTSGWEELNLVRARSWGEGCHDPILLDPGETLDLIPGPTQLRCDETYLMSVPYRILPEAEEGARHIYQQMYSNAFDVGDAPDGIAGDLYYAQVTFHLPEPQVTFENHSTTSKWIVPLCAGEILEEAPDVPGWYPYTTLERVTEWGTWEVIVPGIQRCARDVAPIEIPRESTKKIALWEGVGFDVEELEPGLYRWHLVFYGTKPQVGYIGSPHHHRFSEVFEVQDWVP